MRDTRDIAWRALGAVARSKRLDPDFECSHVCEQKFQLFMSDIYQAIEMFLAQRASKKHPSDRPWITKKIKGWIRKSQSAFIQHGKDSQAYRYWTNKVHGAIKTEKFYYQQQWLMWVT